MEDRTWISDPKGGSPFQTDRAGTLRSSSPVRWPRPASRTGWGISGSRIPTSFWPTARAAGAGRWPGVEVTAVSPKGIAELCELVETRDGQ
ncbi:hypothetical protein [Streptomyces sp. NPDC001933]|uniref:hypothetical protein n=1 Tax=Streptomyces sp. NPDC001933 TaxID=3364626 RepID=UPI0036B6A155